MAQSQPPTLSVKSPLDACASSVDVPTLGRDRDGFAALPLPLALHLEEVCGRFEAAWQSVGTGSSEPQPGDYLSSVPEEGRQTLFRELFRIDLAYRRETGKSPNLEEYQQRFPGLERDWLLGALAVAAVTTTAIPPGQPETRAAVGSGSRTPLDADMSVSLPTRFDDYELLEEIARGGMGVVYKARQLSLNRIVALKMILGGGALIDESVQRFHREARAAAALDHPNIVAIHDSGQYEGRPYFTMAYVEGDNLREVVRRDGLPTPHQAADWLQAIAEAMAYAHQHGIIHRDLKPVNVLIDRQGRPLVTDFGLAYQPETPTADDRLTHTGQVLGTPSYMSPEQAMSKHDMVGSGSDIYSLGGILYFLLTGQAPFQGSSPTEVLCQVVMHAPKPPRQLNPQASPELEAICLRCLEKDPAQRYPSAEALAAALRAAATQSDTPAAEPLAPLPAAKARSRRIWVGPAIVALVGIAVGLWLTSPYWMKWVATVFPSASQELTQLPPPENPRTDFLLEVAMLGIQPDGEQVELQPDADAMFHLQAGEAVKFRIKVARESYVGVWSMNADGTVHQLFPNKYEPNHFFLKDQVRTVPATRAKAKLSGGMDWIWVQASAERWEPGEGQRLGPFLLFQTLQEREQWVQRLRGIELDLETPLAETVLKFRVDP